MQNVRPFGQFRGIWGFSKKKRTLQPFSSSLGVAKMMGAAKQSKYQKNGWQPTAFVLDTYKKLWFKKNTL